MRRDVFSASILKSIASVDRRYVLQFFH